MDNIDLGQRNVHPYPTSQKRILRSTNPTLQSSLFPQAYRKRTFHDSSRSITCLARRAHVQELLAAIPPLHATYRCSIHIVLDNCVYNLVHFSRWVCIFKGFSWGT